ncbi:MAG: RluA family pseudouridine synthase [Candidatus Gracilibacteria bacterium]|nr:RluA family pseudouridine synthase [Candidatus Gracilibacteria bacterium]
MRYIFCVLIEKNIRVDMYLSTLFSDFSRSYIQKIIDRGQIKVNGKEINKNIKIKNKDEIYIDIIIEKLELKAENLNLDIVFENHDFIIVNKDAGINTHPVPGENGKSGTLVNALLFHTKDLASIGGIERPGIVHRLDKDTSGLIIVAKNDKTMKELQKIIQERKIEKYYIAVVKGLIKEKSFKIESFIGRHPNDRLKMTTKNPLNGKIAITHGKVLGYIDDKFSVLEIKLETGRTHQIRVHLSSIGYPIIGDKIYGDQKINKEVYQDYGLNRQALHAYKLKFYLYNKDYEFKGELKKDINKIIHIQL